MIACSNRFRGFDIDDDDSLSVDKSGFDDEKQMLWFYSTRTYDSICIIIPSMSSVIHIGRIISDIY